MEAYIICKDLADWGLEGVKNFPNQDSGTLTSGREIEHVVAGLRPAVGC